MRRYAPPLKLGTFFGYFLCASKESDPSVSPEAFVHAMSRIAIITRIGAPWVPAFAGMTSKKAKSLDSRLRGNDG